MIHRLLKPLKSNSFFIFGARGTGKSTFIKEFLPQTSYYVDLLDDETYDTLLLDSKNLERVCDEKKHEWIIIDEVQRIPKLLNLAHRYIEKTKQKFALTGSNSRKLRRGGANLLAGRAFVNTLYPLLSEELGGQFKLQDVLHWGSLPKLLSLQTPEEKRAYLRSYCLTYIREEIQAEQTVRKLEPFREFLGVAAQSSGKIINYSAIGREVGAQVSSVQTYFQILEDTYLGFLLPHFHRSVRKSQVVAPKFYFFDNGVKKALEGTLDAAPAPSTSQFGELFEAFVIQELVRLNDYFQKDFRFSYFRTKNDAEIDLILTKGRRTILIEIKSAKKQDSIALRKFSKLSSDFGVGVEAFYLNQDSEIYKEYGVQCQPWWEFLKQFPKL